MGTLAFAEAALTLIPKLVALGIDITTLVSETQEVLRKPEPSEEDWKKLHAREDQLRAKLNKDPV